MFVATFVRHGETKLNAAKVVQSRTHGELSERGVKMAESLGRHLREERWTRVFSSDLQRCHETTLNILKHSSHPHPEITLHPVLRERDYGELEFQPTSTLQELMDETGRMTHAIPVPGGETYEATIERTGSFFNMLCKLADDSNEAENVLVVTHGAWILCFLDYLAGNREEYEMEGWREEWPRTPPRNTATSRIAIAKAPQDAKKRTLSFIHAHDTSHLPSDI